MSTLPIESIESFNSKPLNSHVSISDQTINWRLKAEAIWLLSLGFLQYSTSLDPLENCYDEAMTEIGNNSLLPRYAIL